MEQWPLGTLLLTVTKEKKALQGLVLAITNSGLQMTLVTLSPCLLVKLVNGFDQQKAAKKCKSTMCPESQE